MRLLVSLVLGLLVCIAGVVYTLSQPKLYEANGMLDQPNTPNVPGEARHLQPSLERTVSLLGSPDIAHGVAQRLSEEESHRLIAPYAERKGLSEKDISPEEYLRQSNPERFRTVRETRMIQLSFLHEDPEIAALIVNHYMREVIDHYLKRNLDKRMKEVEATRIRYDETIQAISELEAEIVVLESKTARDETTARILQELKDKLKELSEVRDELKQTLTTEIVGGPLAKIPVRLAFEATVPVVYARPNVPLFCLFSGLAGLFAAVVSFLLLRLIPPFSSMR